MDLRILSPDFQPKALLDTFESLIWTDRYCGYGDFELYEKVSPEILSLLQPDCIIQSPGSEHAMIVEDKKLEEDPENGTHVIFTGRSLESILDRRIIWQQTVLSGNLQNGIEKLLLENIISPVLAERVIPNFIFEPSSDPIITSLTVDAQYIYNNLYDVITFLCLTNNIGYKITLSDSWEFVFKLYAGVDRSYNQTIEPYVIFSPNFDNLISGNYSEIKSKMRNVALVGGEGEGEDRIMTIVGSETSLARREIMTDASDLSQTTDTEVLSDEEYHAQLAQRGTEDLIARGIEKKFESSVDTSQMFKYGEDFFLGDIVQQEVSEYGIQSKARVTEVIYSQSTSSTDVCPTFAMID
jgi:hypothetical protein